MSLIKRERRQFAPEPIIPPFPGVGVGNSSPPTMDRAMQVSGVWACVRLLADTVSMMPLHAYTMQRGVRVPVPDPPLLVRPSSDASTPDWVYMLMVSLLLRGNAYGRIVRRDIYGYPAQIEILNPDSVSVSLVDGKSVYTVGNGSGVVLQASEVLHIRAYRMPGLSCGLSPIQYAAQSINTDAAIAKFALGYFQDAPHPASVLTSDQAIDQEKARTIKERITTSVSGREPLVLGAGLKFDTLSVSPEESQFLATQKFGLGQIARIYGVPPEMVGGEAGNSMSYSNREQRAYDFLTYGVQAWLTRIEAALAEIMPGNKHARFDTSVLTRTDLETTIRAGAIAIASKQNDPDEVRAWRDDPPLTDEQKEWLDIIPLTVSPTGRPQSVPVADPADEGEPNGQEV